MDKNKKPHSRDKKLVSGTADVRRGAQVAVNGPVGSGGRGSDEDARRDEDDKEEGR